MAMLYVRDLMTSDVLTVGPGEDLTNLYDLMDARHVRHIPVVDADGELVGLVTHRDLVRSVLGYVADLPLSEQRVVLQRVLVQEIMQLDPEAVGPNMEIGEAAALMLDNKFGCLPVVEGSQLVGILTEADFVKHVVGQQEHDRPVMLPADGRGGAFPPPLTDLQP